MRREPRFGVLHAYYLPHGFPSSLTPALEQVSLDDATCVPAPSGNGYGQHAGAQQSHGHVVAHLVSPIADVDNTADSELAFPVVAPPSHSVVVHDGGRVSKTGGNRDRLNSRAQGDLGKEVAHVSVVVSTVLSVVEAELSRRGMTKNEETKKQRQRQNSLQSWVG